MKIRIKNIGLISNSDIEMNGITVIGGFNNSGKSTILKAVYGLLNANYEIKGKIDLERKKSMDQALNENGFSFLLGNEDLENFLELFLNNQDLEKTMIDYEAFFSFFQKAAEEIKGEYEIHNILFEENNENFEEHYVRQIKKLYQAYEKILKTKEKDYQKFILNRTIRNVFSGDVNSRKYQEIGSTEIETGGEISFFHFNHNQLDDFKMFSDFRKNVWYLNTSHFMDFADRRNFFSQELRNALQVDMDMDMLFEEYNDIEENSEKLQSIFTDILHGKLKKREFGSILYRDDLLEASFHMENVASGMKNLLVVQRMLENGTLGKSSILLIDEPETNLHPDWQIKYAKILVLLNRELGIQLLVNSHSPYFIRAIEVALADYDRKDMGRYYLMESNEEGMYVAKDVTGCTEEIYKLLYKPLDYL